MDIPDGIALPANIGVKVTATAATGTTSNTSGLGTVSSTADDTKADSTTK